MLKRIDDFYYFLGIKENEKKTGVWLAEQYGEKALGMIDTHDYLAFAAIALHYKPKRIFEIGTYLGLTSDFFLNILPESQVVSIAYTNPRWRFFGRIFNNSDLMKEKIGSKVMEERRARFMQLYGDAHKLKSGPFVKKHGRFDLVLIDGDHSAKRCGPGYSARAENHF